MTWLVRTVPRPSAPRRTFDDRLEAFGVAVDVAEFDEAVAELVVALAAEVAEGEEFILGLFEDLADRHEAAALEAVVGADGEREVFDGGVVAVGRHAEAGVRQDAR